jgi:flagellar biogenesis protein FliO
MDLGPHNSDLNCINHLLLIILIIVLIIYIFKKKITANVKAIKTPRAY